LKELVGPRGPGSHVEGNRGVVVDTATVKSAGQKDVTVSPVNGHAGIQTSENGLLSKTVASKDQPFRCTGLICAEEGIDGEMSSPYRVVDGARMKSSSNSPPRRRKKKGIAELGDSCPQLRRSTRLSVKHLQGGLLPCSREGQSSISISDTAIRNCNSRWCDPVKVDEPARLWEVGKQAGLKCRGEEKEVSEEFGRMEVRDEEVLGGAKSSGKIVV